MVGRGTHAHPQGLVNRRDFLKMGALAAVPLLMGRLPAMVLAEDSDPADQYSETMAAPAPLGRVATWVRQAIRKEPAPGAELVAWASRDDVLPLHAAVQGEPPWPTNPVWYQTDGGYVHSGYVQPVRHHPQPPVDEVGEEGFWAQVSVPWAEARWAPASPYYAYKLYYGTVYRVIASVVGPDDQVWYQLKEGITPWRAGPFVPASTLQRVAPEALTPISPGRPDKRIVIDRQVQTLSCLEGDEVVFSTPVSTGHAQTATPGGEYRVLYKRTTRRMTVTNISDPYDLPGVPFTVYFTWNGVAIHGTYWHNDYGRVHSHGCVNATPEAAQWIFRWAEPVVPYEAHTVHAEPAEAGTPILVI